MAHINLATAEIRTDENMIDSMGFPLREAAVYEGNIIVCHPNFEHTLREAQELFFKPQQQQEEGGEDE